MEAMVLKVMDNKAMEATDNKVTEVTDNKVTEAMDNKVTEAMDNKVMEATDNKVMAVNLILMVLPNLMVAAILMVLPNLMVAVMFLNQPMNTRRKNMKVKPILKRLQLTPKITADILILMVPPNPMVAVILMVLPNLMVAVILMVHLCPRLMVDMESHTLQNLIHLLHQPTEDMGNHQNLTCLVLPRLTVTRDPRMDNRWAIPDHPMDKKDTIKEATKAQQMTISTLKVQLVTSNLL